MIPVAHSKKTKSMPLTGTIARALGKISKGPSIFSEKAERNDSSYSRKMNSSQHSGKMSGSTLHYKKMSGNSSYPRRMSSGSTHCRRMGNGYAHPRRMSCGSSHCRRMSSGSSHSGKMSCGSSHSGNMSSGSSHSGKMKSGSSHSGKMKSSSSHSGKMKSGSSQTRKINSGSSHSKKKNSSSSYSRKKIQTSKQKPSHSSSSWSCDALSSTESTIACTDHSSADLHSSEQELRSSGAISVESDTAEELAELARSITVISAAIGADEKEALAGLADELKQRRGSSWVDFSSSSDFGAVGETQTPNQRRATALWSRHRLDQLSWLNLEEILNDDLDEETPDDGVEALQLGVKCVRFAGPSRDTVRDSITVSDMTKEELLQCWYDERDHERLQIDAVETINFFRFAGDIDVGKSTGGSGGVSGVAHKKDEGGFEEDVHFTKEKKQREETWCSRGLEHVISEEAFAKRENRRSAVKAAVLAEQDVQKRRIQSGEGGSGNEQGSQSNTVAIANASMAISRGSMQEAVAKGREDATVAKTFMPVTRLQKMRFKQGIVKAHLRTHTAKTA